MSTVPLARLPVRQTKLAPGEAMLAYWQTSIKVGIRVS